MDAGVESVLVSGVLSAGGGAQPALHDVQREGGLRTRLQLVDVARLEEVFRREMQGGGLNGPTAGDCQ